MLKLIEKLKLSVNRFLKEEISTSYNNYTATASLYQSCPANFNEYQKFSFAQRSYSSLTTSSFELFKRKSILNPNRKWKYTEYGKELNEFNYHKEKLAKFDESTKIKLENQQTSAGNNKHHNKPFIFKVCTYNLLAPDLVEKNRELYKNIDWRTLDWKNRKNKIYHDLKRLNADIYCFQEMQEDQFNSFFLPKLKKYGNLKIDGCALCFSQRKFELIKIELIDFYKPDVEILNRENVGIIALLKAKKEINKSDHINKDKLICVATTHILYNPKRGDCKLAQVQLLLAHLDKMAYKGSKLIENKLVPTYWPTILCGDFNCSNASKLYEFITKSKLKNYKSLNRNDLSGQFHNSSSFKQIESTILPEHLGISDQSQFSDEVNERIREAISENNDNTSDDYLNAYCSYGGCHLRHTFHFKSAYSHYNENGDLEISSIVGDEPKKTVDFIFYHSEPTHNNQKNNDPDSDKEDNMKTFIVSKKRIQNFNENENELELVANLELFTLNQLDNVYLPNENYPSDHFLLASKFALN